MDACESLFDDRVKKIDERYSKEISSNFDVNY